MILFPKQCQIARILMDMTQKQLAEALDVTNVQVSRWETGEMEISETKKRLFYTLCDKHHITFSPTGMPMVRPTPEVPSDKCPRCGIGIDDNGDGDCAVCHGRDVKKEVVNG